MEPTTMYQITPNNAFNMYRYRMPIDTSSNTFNVMDSLQPRLSSIIAIGNPIVDILAEIEKEIVQRFKLVWGGTFFASKDNMGFFDELESRPQVTYIPGGSIQNTLRVTNWCLNMEEKNKGKFRVTMLGAIGQDNYKDKIMNALNSAGVIPLLQPIPNITTSRCGVGICQKERCLLPHIKASNCLTDQFVKEHENEIFNNDALLIEGYFLQEKYELCIYLSNMFKRANKMVILTLSAVFMVENHREKIMKIAEISDMIVGNLEEMEAFAEVQRTEPQITIAKAHEKLGQKDRLFIVTDGGNGVYVTKYDYEKKGLDYFLQSYPNKLKNEEICDLNGAGDAFLGGFLSQYMKGASLEQCCKVGNDAAYVIIKHVGCTFPKTKCIKIENNSLLKI
jgi:adenosine kinase